MDYVKLRTVRMLVGGSEMIEVDKDGIVRDDPWTPLLNNELFVVELVPPGFDIKSSFSPSFYEPITMTSVTPLELLDMDCDFPPEVILGWTQRYGVPNPGRRKSTPYVLKDKEGGEVSPIYNYSSIRRMRQDFYDIATALKLWRWIAEKDVSAIRDFIHIKNEFFAWKFVWKNVSGSILEQDSCNLPNEWAAKGGKIVSEFEADDTIALQSAITVLACIANRGLNNYPPIPQVNTEVSPTGLNSFLTVTDYMSYIWSIIHEGICSKKLHKWPYKSCIDCKKWEDVSQPGHRNTWIRCEACTKKFRTRSSAEHKRAKRDAEGLPKVSRTRPTAKK